MSDYIERLRGELLRAEATQPRLRPQWRPVLALAAVAAVVAAVLVFMPSTPDREVPAGTSYHVEGDAQATANVLRKRMAAAGIAGEVTVSGEQLTIPEAARSLAVPGKLGIYDSEQGAPDQPALDNAAVTGARTSEDQMTREPIVLLQLTPAGQEQFHALTRTLAHRGKDVGELQHLKIAVDGHVYSEPYIDGRIAPDGIDGAAGVQISGGFTRAQARELAALLNSGPLPGELR